MPSNDNNVLIILALILAGLVITTTCIDIIGGHYIDKLHFFGRRLDIEVLLAVLPFFSSTISSFRILCFG